MGKSPSQSFEANLIFAKWKNKSILIIGAARLLIGA